MKDTPLNDGDLAYIGSRTLAKVANAAPDIKEKVAKKLKAGEKVTATTVDKMLEGAADVVINSARTKGASEKQIKTLQAENEELKAENLLLKKRIKELEADLAKV